MDHTKRAMNELLEMDELAAGHSPLHRLHPMVKLLTTVLYILLVASFGKYDLSGVAIMALYPAVLFQLGGIPVSTCFYKLRVVLPLVCAVGLFNPFFDRQPLFYIGTAAVSGGMVSMFTLLLKGIFCLMASFLLAATTPVDALCAALRRLHVPGVLVTLALLTCRYLSVMAQEVGVMTEAYHLRAPGQKGIHHSAWGSFLGQLLLRSMDRAGELYSSMRLRGFRHEFPYAGVSACRGRDLLYLFVCTALLLACRLFPVTQALGSLFL